jgi:hypothetical protein
MKTKVRLLLAIKAAQRTFVGATALGSALVAVVVLSYMPTLLAIGVGLYLSYQVGGMILG